MNNISTNKSLWIKWINILNEVMDNMRILLISAVPPPRGGIATWSLRYLDYLKKHQIDVDLVNTALNGERGNRINSKRRVNDEILRTWRIFNAMKKQLKNKPDIVHINSSCSTFGIIRDYICVCMAKKNNIPIFFHCHCNIGDQIQKTYGRAILKKIFDIVEQVWVLNKDSYKFAKELNAKEIKIIPNFVGEDSLGDIHTINNEIEEVIFVGHVQPTKGCKEIFNIARRLPKVHFRLVGPINDEIKRLQCPKNVTLEGECNSEQIKRFLSASDVYLFPSHTEGFSLSLTEAMANGLPCIATNVGANEDMLENQGGIIVPVKNEDAIVKALHVIAEKGKREKMSEWNINKVRNMYTVEKVMQQIVDTYKSVLKNL